MFSVTLVANDDDQSGFGPVSQKALANGIKVWRRGQLTDISDRLQSVKGRTCFVRVRYTTLSLRMISQ